MKQREDIPTHLVREVKTMRTYGNETATYVSWWPYHNLEDARNAIANDDRPGFGQEYDSIVFDIFGIETTHVETINPIPVTMAEAALELEQYDSNGCTQLGVGVKVKIGLRGKGYDPASVYWTQSGNSFAIVKPNADLASHNRLTTKQGVMLVSVNGIGEIRWDVTKISSQYGEDLEAFKHFNLEW